MAIWLFGMLTWFFLNLFFTWLFSFIWKHAFFNNRGFIWLILRNLLMTWLIIWWNIFWSTKNRLYFNRNIIFPSWSQCFFMFFTTLVIIFIISNQIGSNRLIDVLNICLRKDWAIPDLNTFSSSTRRNTILYIFRNIFVILHFFLFFAVE